MKKNRFLALILAVAATLTLFACDAGETADNPIGTETVDDSGDEAVVTAEPYEPDESLSAARVAIEGTKFMVDGKELWINGVNTPWDKWNDFGGSFDEEFWDSHFAELHEAGINATRVWVNCNGVSIVRLESDGTVRSVNPEHWQDVDTLFRLAEKYEIYLMPTLLSFDHFKDSNAGYKLWRQLVSTDAGTESYIESYVIPFAERYGDSPYLLGIDLCNEPDWIVENDECGKISWEIMAPFFAKCAAAIHDNSNAYVTLGLGMIKYNSDKYEGNYVSDEYLSSLAGESAYLDFYSPHYYDWQRPWMGYPFESSPTEFGLDGTKPVVIGEFAADGGNEGTTARYLGAYENGWNGVMAWTSNGVDDCGNLEHIQPAAAEILAVAEEKVFPLD